MTYEEISTKYPIGKLLYREIAKEKRSAFWANETDKELYLKKYPDAQFTDNGGVIYTTTFVNEKRVEGWIVTNEGFFVAEDSWDGWVPLDEDDLESYEKIGIDYEF